MIVPFLDLKVQYYSIKNEIHDAINSVLEKTAFAGGPFVKQFEENYARYCNTKYAVGVSSGTSAIWLALKALGIGPGDEVITVPNTFIATAEAISLCGAKPVLIDIDRTTYTMDPALLEEAITGKTKAIIPVHLFGQICDMDPIMEIARRYNLYVVEDAAQAHGAEYKGKKAGQFGDAACFSFYPGKNLGAYGEAGAVVTNNQDIYDAIKIVRDHGQTSKYIHSVVGWNARMDGIQGAILDVKLRYIDAWNEARRKNAQLYEKLLSENERVIFPKECETGKHVYHIYAVRVKHRDDVLKKMAERKIACGIHYPVPVHLMEAYASLNYKMGSFPVSETCTSEFLSLPMFPELSEKQIHFVVDNLKSVVNS